MRHKSWPFVFIVNENRCDVYDERAHIGYIGSVYIKNDKVYKHFANSNDNNYLPVKECLRYLGQEDYDVGV